MNTIKRLVVCLLLLIGLMEVVLAQEKLNGFVINPDSNCPFTIRPGEGDYGFVVINTTLSNLNFSIPNAPKRLVNADYKTERQQWILKIVPNDNNYKRYKITINSKGFKQGEIDVRVRQKESQCFDVDPLHENVTEVASEEDRIHILPRVDVSYYEEGEWRNNRLYAKVEGVEYKIDIPIESEDPHDLDKGKCSSIALQEDFDSNGINDVLIEDSGCEDFCFDYYIVSYSEDGYFLISNSVWGCDYLFEDWKDKKSILVFDHEIGWETRKERYIFNNGKLELAETLIKPLLVAVKELNPCDFNFNQEEGRIRLEYDLDGNGITDYFDCLCWYRWDLLMIDCFVLNGKEIKDVFLNNGIRRIGVLSSITNGYHDLVLNEDVIIKWDGKKYVFPQ